MAARTFSPKREGVTLGCMKRLIGAVALFLLMIASLLHAETKKFGPANPFFAPSPLPFHAPPFNKIKDTDYQPAIEAGMAEQLRNFGAVTDSRPVRSLEKTLFASEKSG